MKQNSAVIIPALEPEENLVEYIQKLIDSGIRKIIVVMMEAERITNISLRGLVIFQNVI